MPYLNLHISSMRPILHQPPQEKEGHIMEAVWFHCWGEDLGNLNGGPGAALYIMDTSSVILVQQCLGAGHGRPGMGWHPWICWCGEDLLDIDLHKGRYRIMGKVAAVMDTGLGIPLFSLPKNLPALHWATGFVCGFCTGVSFINRIRCEHCKIGSCISSKYSFIFCLLPPNLHLLNFKSEQEKTHLPFCF